jgi:hypothetical protein
MDTKKLSAFKYAFISQFLYSGNPLPEYAGLSMDLSIIDLSDYDKPNKDVLSAKLRNIDITPFILKDIKKVKLKQFDKEVTLSIDDIKRLDYTFFEALFDMDTHFPSVYINNEYILSNISIKKVIELLIVVNSDKYGGIPPKD